jgi:hypothetical protein
MGNFSRHLKMVHGHWETAVRFGKCVYESRQLLCGMFIRTRRHVPTSNRLHDHVQRYFHSLPDFYGLAWRVLAASWLEWSE